MSRTPTTARTRSTRLALALALGTLAGLAAPAASQAATLSRATGGGNDYVRYDAAPGEANQLEVRAGPAGTIAFVDPGATISAHAPCVSVSAHEARCADAMVHALGVALGDRNDGLTVDVAKPGFYSGDAGNDTLTGGPGDEALWGGAGNDVLDGRGGADLMAGQDGVDTVSYAARTAPVTVDLASVTFGQEGEAGERDTVASDVERVTGGSGDDTLTGNAAANLLDGRAGNDLVTGGGGADDLRGGPGDDTLRARDGVVDRVDCGTDADAVDADATDTVSGCESAAPAPVTAPAPPAPPTPAFSSIFGELELPRQPVVLHHGHVTLTIACPADTPSGRCAGVISFERVAPHGKTATAHSSRRTRRFRIADQAYSVKAGKQARLRVRISSVGRRAVRRAGSLKVKVYVRRTKRATRTTRVGTLRVHASRRTKRRPGTVAT